MESKSINNDIKAIKESDNMRFMIYSLLKSVNKISEIEKKLSLIDNKEPDKNFTDNMRFMIYSLSKSVNKISEIDKEISRIDRKMISNMPYKDKNNTICIINIKCVDKILTYNGIF